MLQGRIAATSNLSIIQPFIKVADGSTYLVRCITFGGTWDWLNIDFCIDHGSFDVKAFIILLVRVLIFSKILHFVQQPQITLLALSTDTLFLGSLTPFSLPEEINEQI